ncbi:predicted protein [Lichtheimia corymbifera JMRC:FSU:9682]|uniref:Uncharacterized protein n=1 Tax=Lichtheimia corymbifera JMRC:FSU:9682 TaxID=1263082 RepID=A0A068RHC6_9FUNG|nr:predicted protein [Lichtheimia corymbifera JMRC:FSU:9682]
MESDGDIDAVLVSKISGIHRSSSSLLPVFIVLFVTFDPTPECDGRLQADGVLWPPKVSGFSFGDIRTMFNGEIDPCEYKEPSKQFKSQPQGQASSPGSPGNSGISPL